MLNELNRAIDKAQAFLLEAQKEPGYWVGELEADASVTAGYIPLMHFMGVSIAPARLRKAVHFLVRRQNEDGSWGSYYGGPGNLNVTAQVYFALKLARVPEPEPTLVKARDFILSRGGLAGTNTITKIWLALFGQYDYQGTPSIPAEIILLPKWSYFNIYEFASWSRETIMALILILNTRPICSIPEYASVSELLIPRVKRYGPTPLANKNLFTWRSFFTFSDRVLKATDRWKLKLLRQMALRKVEKWVVDHQESDGSWGGILLPWVYSLMALKSLDRDLNRAVIERGMNGLESFIVEDDQDMKLQPATSPVWDTAWATLALLESGLPLDHSSLVRAGQWLLSKEVRGGGDWKIKNPHTEPGGWAFEFVNQFYPDIDDASVVGRCLSSLKLAEADEARKWEALNRASRWVEEMQSRDGGWAAFDRDNDKKILASVPFADFMTPLDPTSPDVTAHAIEFLCALGGRSSSLNRALDYLKTAQEEDGSWYGRWGVNYIYGSALVLTCLKSAGQDMSQDWIQKAVRWLISLHNPDGGWGESCETYDNPQTGGRGKSTPSQTAWALMGLLAAQVQTPRCVEEGISFLVERQEPGGWWNEAEFTGTGFPRAFYLHYDLYRTYFPLLALAQFRHHIEKNSMKAF